MLVISFGPFTPMRTSTDINLIHNIVLSIHYNALCRFFQNKTYHSHFLAADACTFSFLLAQAFEI
eukprot:c20431_g1_i2 orf=291-485(+)